MDSERRLVGWSAVLVPAVHALTDLAEWLQGGFSPPQLWANYAAFLAVPALLVGLYAVQRPLITRPGLWGALLYGAAFVYFAHTTLTALEGGIGTYAQLWNRAGTSYTVHGAVMVVGGLAFGAATLRAGLFPAWTGWLFLAGVTVNLVLAFFSLPEMLQTLGSGLRNAGLIGMGWAALHRLPARRAIELVKLLGLSPHPEGGYYREIHRSSGSVAPGDGRSARAALTVIWFLLPGGAASRWHRVRSDEVWQHCEGAPLELFQVSEDDWQLEPVRLGPLGPGQRPVHCIPAGRWQAARPLGSYTLVSCSVGPGFDFADFELLSARPALAAELARRLPEQASLV